MTKNSHRRTFNCELDQNIDEIWPKYKYIINITTTMNINLWIWPKNENIIKYHHNDEHEGVNMTKIINFWSSSHVNVRPCQFFGHVHQFWSSGCTFLLVDIEWPRFQACQHLQIALSSWSTVDIVNAVDNQNCCAFPYALFAHF